MQVILPGDNYIIGSLFGEGLFGELFLHTFLKYESSLEVQTW